MVVDADACVRQWKNISIIITVEILIAMFQIPQVGMLTAAHTLRASQTRDNSFRTLREAAALNRV